jgi:hypothetical protein
MLNALENVAEIQLQNKQQEFKCSSKEKLEKLTEAICSMYKLMKLNF